MRRLPMETIWAVLGDAGRSATKMNFIRLIVTACLLALVGCSEPTTRSTTPHEPLFDPTAYSPGVQPFLLKLHSLVENYNSEARGIELSEHGVDGHLNDAEAKRLAAFANAIIDKLNASFDKPVAQKIGESWYQVPSRFKIKEAEAHSGVARTFTVSHHNCGVYEYDFIVDAGVGTVVGNRYDSLGISW